MRKDLLYIFITISIVGCKTDIDKLTPKAYFDYSYSENESLQYTITFSNHSENAIEFLWNFGDGSISSEKEPVHSYSNAGSYNVRLYASDGLLTDSISRFIIIELGKPLVRFVYSPSDDLFINNSIKFTNWSKYSTNYLWDFGDGTKSSEKNPNHIYPSAGYYNVKLIASNGYKIDSITKSIYIKDTILFNNLKVTDNNIDCDKDGVSDINIGVFSYFTTTTTGRLTKIIPLNNFEIFTDTTSEIHIKTTTNESTKTLYKIDIPKIYKYGDIISETNNSTNIGIDIARSSATFNSDNIYSWRNDIWIKDDVRYIGYRKVTNNKSKIGWIKLKVLSFDDLILISLKLPMEKTSLMIDN